LEKKNKVFEKQVWQGNAHRDSIFGEDSTTFAHRTKTQRERNAWLARPTPSAGDALSLAVTFRRSKFRS
jgi:D-alanyl-D-alanine carboxypeptidase